MDIRTLVSGALFISLVMAAVGVGLTMIPTWRQRAVKVMPVVLAVTTFVVSAYFFLTQDLTFSVLITGIFDPSWVTVCAGIVIGIVLASVAFWIEAKGTQLWYRYHDTSRDVSFLYVPVAGRSDTMSAVADLAQRGLTFALLSVFSACGEEAYYRGVFLLGGSILTNQNIVILILAQAILYGVNHVAFGVPAVIGKSILGIALGVSALVGGIPASLLAHLAYQVLVALQFRIH